MFFCHLAHCIVLKKSQKNTNVRYAVSQGVKNVSVETVGGLEVEIVLVEPPGQRV